MGRQSGITGSRLFWGSAYITKLEVEPARQHKKKENVGDPFHRLMEYCQPISNIPIVLSAKPTATDRNFID
jgi:hypothetical protein